MTQIEEYFSECSIQKDQEIRDRFSQEEPDSCVEWEDNSSFERRTGVMY